MGYWQAYHSQPAIMVSTAYNRAPMRPVEQAISRLECVASPKPHAAAGLLGALPPAIPSPFMSSFSHPVILKLPKLFVPCSFR
jgi:hypothetical protein